MPYVRCLRCGEQTYLDPYAYTNYRGKVRCKHCLALHEMSQEGMELRVWELALPFEVSIPESVPVGAKEDVLEGATCLENGAPRACVVMCRRALGHIANLKGAKGRWLAEKIDDLHKKGLISDITHSMAKPIREFGNYGAHREDDLLDRVDGRTAEDIMRITLRLLEELYPKHEAEPRVLSER